MPASKAVKAVAPRKTPPAVINTIQIDPYLAMMELSVKSDGGIEKLDKLMQLQERWESNNAKKSFNLAMSRFQSIIPVIECKGVVDYTSSKGRTYYTYAKLEDIAKAIKPALKETGLSYRFKQHQENMLITVECIVTHEDGHSDSSTMSSMPDTSGGKDPLKSQASTVSCLRRYTLTGLLGVVVGGEDNDATDPATEQQPAQQQCYPDADFQKNVGKWSEMIQKGTKTADELHTFLLNKNVILSEDQYNTLCEAGNQ